MVVEAKVLYLVSPANCAALEPHSWVVLVAYNVMVADLLVVRSLHLEIVLEAGPEEHDTPTSKWSGLGKDLVVLGIFQLVHCDVAVLSNMGHWGADDFVAYLLRTLLVVETHGLCLSPYL